MPTSVSGFTDEQIDQLKDKLDRSQVKERKQAGQTLSYIEGWWAQSEANRIFGHDAWDQVVTQLEKVVERDRGDGKFEVAYIARVLVTVRHQSGIVVREGTGYGSGIAKQIGDAFEGATKEAETDAFKRAIKSFGNPFGLALYDKTQTNVGEAQHTPEAVSLRDLIARDIKAMDNHTKTLVAYPADAAIVKAANNWMMEKIDGKPRWQILQKADTDRFSEFSAAMNTAKIKSKERSPA